jgi:hypothetical protein
MGGWNDWFLFPMLGIKVIRESVMWSGQVTVARGRKDTESYRIALKASKSE